MILQGIGGVIKPLSQWKKLFKLSTTHFFLMCPVIRSCRGSYFLGMGKVWRSNSNWEDHPFWKNVFLTCGVSKCLEMHAQAIIHPRLSFSPILMEFWLSHAARRWLSSLSPSWFDVVSSLLHAQNSFSLLLGKWEERSHNFWVWEGHFFQCE